MRCLIVLRKVLERQALKAFGAAIWNCVLLVFVKILLVFVLGLSLRRRFDMSYHVYWK
jgi:hypothetical protein